MIEISDLRRIFILLKEGLTMFIVLRTWRRPAAPKY